MNFSKENWQAVKAALIAKNSSNPMFQSFFGPTELESVVEDSSGRKLCLTVPSDLHKYWISQNLMDTISGEIAAQYKYPFFLELLVKDQQSVYKQTTFDLTSAQAATEQSQPAKPMSDEGRNQLRGIPSDRRDILNGDYVFSTFVVGRNNEFAHAACFNIAENPGMENYNPLFICGPTGMGKTHLLNAVGNHIRTKNQELRICYVSAERFLNECISSIRRNEMDKFRLRYRVNCDVLLMDDIQILGRGEAVQEEFFHTLNHFFDKGQQVVVASDRMPKDIMGLEDRIRTRLEWGLIADIQMPDIETRVAILRYKAERRGLRLSPDVVSYIARISKRSIRELEGNLNKVKMFSELQGLPISIELARKALSGHDDTVVISMDELQKLACEHYKIRLNDLKSTSRTKPIILARQVAMFLIKKHLDKSLVDIGRAFGGRDHTTVINALRRIEDHLSKDTDLRRDVEEIEQRIHNITGL